MSVDLTYELSPVDVVDAIGPDAASFLHGQLSQNIEALEVGDRVDSLLLLPDGHLLTTLRVHRTSADVCRLVLPAGTADVVVPRLRRFLLRTDCELDVHDGWQLATVIGASATELAAAHPRIADAIDELGWPGVLGATVLWGPDAPMPAPLVGATLDPTAVDDVRIRAGVPAFGHELSAGQLANEGGRGFIESHVDFTKGCYVGQELIARVHHRGANTPHRVVRLEPVDGDDSSVVAAGPYRTGDDDVVVRVTTSGRGAALALAPRRVADGATVVGPDGSDHRVVPIE